MNAAIDAPADTLPLGELRAIHREEHICPRCEHFMVCRVAAALDPNLLVTITRCLAFAPAAGEADA